LTPALAALTAASHTLALALLGEADIRQTQGGRDNYRHYGDNPIFSLHRGLLKQVLKNFQQKFHGRPQVQLGNAPNM
jgi:hypothetical protein